MEPFEIRTTPARLPAHRLVIAAVVLGFTLFVLWRVLEVTVLAARVLPDDPTRYVVCTGLLLLAYALTWVFLRLVGPTIQVLLMYLFHDRGKRVVAYRLDESGWRHVIAGSDVLVPWEGMAVAVTERTDDLIHVTVTSDGPFRAARNPLSRDLRRHLRKQRGFTVPFTMSEPTEEELARAIAERSAGRVVLAR